MKNNKVTTVFLAFIVFTLASCVGDMSKIRKEDKLRAERLETLKELQQHASQEAIVLSKSEFEGGLFEELGIDVKKNHRQINQKSI